MSGKVIVRNSKSVYLTPLDVYINGKKVGHVKNNGVEEFPISGDCELSVRCGINLQKPKVNIRGGFVTEVQFKITPVIGTFNLEIVSQDTIENTEDKKRKKQEAEAWEKRERRMRCTVCGNVFCYSYSDIKDNQRQTVIAGLSALGTLAGAIGGTRYDMYEQNKNMNAQASKVKDFSRCPHCNSTAIVEIEQNNTNVAQNGSVSASPQLSSTDELKKFKELLDMGIITQEEFNAKKKQLLGL